MAHWFTRAGGRLDGHSDASGRPKGADQAGRAPDTAGDARPGGQGHQTRYVDLGPAADDAAAAGLLVVLPGRGYHPDKPLLSVATQLAVDRGWRVRQVWWSAPAEADAAWAGAELAAAIGDADVPVRLLAKSLASLAAPAAAQAAYPACWLTPLLEQAEVIDAIAANQAHQLLVGGTADGMWVSEIAETLVTSAPHTEMLELPGADHSLAVKGNKNATASAHAEFVRAFGGWLG